MVRFYMIKTNMYQLQFGKDRWILLTANTFGFTICFIFVSVNSCRSLTIYCFLLIYYISRSAAHSDVMNTLQNLISGHLRLNRLNW
jgi:hypothetical protein